MYRESVLGMALGMTLGEIAPFLSDGQRERIWRIFDQTVEECFGEVPVMSRVQVRCPQLDASLAKSKRGLPTTVLPDLESALGSSAALSPPEENSPEGHPVRVEEEVRWGSPVYRCVDGVWTLLLQDPEVTVRDEFGKEETFHLDYMKVYMQEVLQPGAAREERRGAGGVAGGKTARRKRLRD